MHGSMQSQQRLTWHQECAKWQKYVPSGPMEGKGLPSGRPCRGHAVSAVADMEDGELHAWRHAVSAGADVEMWDTMHGCMSQHGADVEGRHAQAARWQGRKACMS